MATLTHPDQLDTQELTYRIERWFLEQGFETKRVGSEGLYAIKARKSSWWRALMAADRAVEVDVRTVGHSTEVIVGQGDWTTNVVSNAVWFAITGGGNLAFSGWSFVIQWQLEAYIRQTMAELAARPQPWCEQGAG